MPGDGTGGTTGDRIGTGDVTVLVNPAAGRGRAVRAVRPVLDALTATGLPVRTLVGADAADALRQARRAVADGARALIAVGGDGMASLALQATAGTDTPLGLVAMGTGNDLARTCGLPLGDPAAAARDLASALTSGAYRPIDLGRVRGPGTRETWFGGVLASGFDSRVSDRGNRMRWPRGRLRYDLAMLRELAAFRPLPYRMRLDDGPWRELDATLVAVGNGSGYGGGMRICPGATLDDGLFDITVVGPCSRATLVRVFPRVYRGTHLTHPVVTVHRAARVVLDAPGLTGYADGEPLGPLPLTATCEPGAVRLLTTRA